MKSIYFKNFSMMAGMVLVSFLIFGIAFTTISRNYTISEKQETLQGNAETLAASIEQYMLRPGSQLSDADVGLYAAYVWKFSGGNDVIVSDTSGVIAATSNSDSNTDFDQGISASILTDINNRGEYYGLGNLNGIYSSAHYVVGLPIVMQSIFGDEVLGYVFVSADASSVMNAWSSFAALFIVVSVGVLMVSTFFSVVTAARQSAPLREMALAANKFAHGDFSARVTDRGRIDEIGELTESFNAMANSLEKSEKLRREFVANVSHELKTPMTSITGFADGILDGTIPEDKQNEYLSIIASETKRLSRLVRSMLDASQIQSMDANEITKDSFNISEVLARTLLSLENKINERGLDVETDLPEKPVMAKGNVDAIVQVVYNLLDNAIKFSEEGTAIGLSLHRKGDKVRVSVRNTGETISPEELPLIFDRFHKTDKSRGLDKEGVGLGLHIVKTIINNHGEDIYATSENGVTEFTFTLTAGGKN